MRRSVIKTKGNRDSLRRDRPIHKSERGQATIEFILALALSLGFVVSFAKLGFSYTNGYLVHYATYMASRAFLVVDVNSNRPSGSDSSAMDRAKEVFEHYQIQNFISGFKNDLKVLYPGDANNPLFIGNYSEYKDSFYLPFFGSRREMNLKSESFLGREPTRAECVDRICSAMKAVGGSCEMFTTISDNGC